VIGSERGGGRAKKRVAEEGGGEGRGREKRMEGGRGALGGGREEGRKDVREGGRVGGRDGQCCGTGGVQLLADFAGLLNRRLRGEVCVIASVAASCTCGSQVVG
jgi:hypothetical protein